MLQWSVAFDMLSVQGFLHHGAAEQESVLRCLVLLAQAGSQAS